MAVIKSDQVSWALKEYVKLLSVSVCVLMLFTVVVAGIASYNYGTAAPFIENISNRDVSPRWTIALLWLPLTLQFIVLVFLAAQVRKEKQDETIRHYFKFYFTKSFMASCAYVTMWWCYTHWMSASADSGVVRSLRAIAFLWIALLVYFVVQATYLVTRSSPRNKKRSFSERNIDQATHDLICERLRAVAKTRSPATSEGAAQSADVLVSESNSSIQSIKQIHKWILRTGNAKVHTVASQGTVEDLDIPDLVTVLNKLIRSRRFYKEWNPNEPEEVSLGEMESANRAHIEECLLAPDKVDSSATQSHTAEIVARDILRFIRAWFRTKLEGWSGTQKRIDRQIGQRNGITMFPFYTLIFFFSIFLCTAYLFAFAFAFEDKQVQLSDARQHMALFMNDDLLEDSKQFSNSSLIRVADFKGSVPFAGKLHSHSEPVSRYLYEQCTANTQELLNNYDGGEVISPALLQALVYEINKVLNDKNLFEKLRFAHVVLREETQSLLDKAPTTGADLTHLNRLLLEDAYPSELARMSENYKLHELQETFFFTSAGAGLQIAAPDSASSIEKFVAQINQTSLDALVGEVTSALYANKNVRLEVIGRADDYSVKGNTYSSNDAIATARVRIIRYAVQQKLIGASVSTDRLANIQWVELPLSNDSSLPLKRDRPYSSQKTEVANNGFLVENDNFAHSNPSRLDEIKRSIESFKNENLKETKQSSEQVIAWWRKVAEITAKAPLTDATIASIYRDIKNWIQATESDGNATELKKKIERNLFQIGDIEGGKRAVEVFLFESLPPSTSPQLETQSKRMALMDYLYFAMNTITTTGNGDIKPITPCSKFLFTLANITEVFFIVVFFNALISLKRTKSEIA